jgi:hypothetical protein
MLFIYQKYGEGRFVGCYMDKVIVRFDNGEEMTLPVNEFTIFDKKQNKTLVYSKHADNTKIIEKSKFISIENRERSRKINHERHKVKIVASKILKANL